MSALLSLSGLKVHYGGFDAVRGLDLTVAAGETVALIGESGCGKSTSALAIMGLLPREARVEGEILFDGRNLRDLSPDALRRLRGGDIAMVFQDSMSALNPVLTVGAQIAESLRLHEGLTGKAAHERAIDLLELVEVPDARHRVNDYPHQFSGGQRQRVAIAMAVACKPRLLIADEPTTALDVTIQARIIALLDRLKRELNMGLLLITHDLGLVHQWADRTAIMLKGVKIEDGPTERIFNQPEQAYTRVLLGAALSLDGEAHYRNTRLAEMTGNGQVTAATHVAPRPVVPDTSGPLLSLHDLRVHYAGRGKGLAAVDGVSFDIARGETVGLVGESGCGKSSLSRAILRLLPTSAGRIVFDGADITRLSDKALKPFRPRLQMAFQDPYAALNPRHRVGDILDGILAANGVKDRSLCRRRILETLAQVQLPAQAIDKFPHEFSGGQRQRIGIARAILLRPDLLICDEPTSSLDLPIRAQMLNLLSDLKAELGLSLLFISHDLSVVRYMADRVLVMKQGRIVEEGNHRDIWAQPRHPYTRSLIDAVPRLKQASPLQSPHTGDIHDRSPFPLVQSADPRQPRPVHAAG